MQGKNILYVLNACDKTELVNGFRYIKEMPLQYQNFKVCETYNLLTSNCIKAYSIESYAFTLAICETSEKMISEMCHV